MLSTIDEILPTHNFPLEKVVGCLNWKHQYAKADLESIKIYTKEHPQTYPVFEINNKKYIPANFGMEATFPKKKTGFKNFQEYYETLDNLQNLKIKNSTVPIKLDMIEGTLYGLIPWIDGPNIATKYYRKKFELSNDFEGMAKAAKEIHHHSFIHLDLNPGNFISSNEIFLTDLSIFKPHYRTSKRWFHERADTRFWAPEVMYGGNRVSKKSSVFSIGLVFKEMTYEISRNGNSKEKEECKKYMALIDWCIEDSPKKRPTFKKVLEEIQKIKQTQP